MRKEHIIQAWKDALYRKHLSSSEQTLLPEHPAGSIELYEQELYEVVGGDDIVTSCTPPFNCCADTILDPCQAPVLV